MSKKMLIDATHPEETRVVVVENGRLEEFDVDTSTKKQIKGNIYLAKVVRVEPSLQAAFIEYGGNRHGFLAFGEIHPDYYQIPVSDREDLKEMMAKEGKSEEDHIEENRRVSDMETVSETENDDHTRRHPSFLKKYKIQEVIRQGQVMLVQVVKEERGNKGAALTTYLSLAGRFSVLMPNNGKGGGVSRKINNTKERKSLREIVEKLPIPAGMSVIIRTAGQGKTKSEIKRDYDYLIKTWIKIRDLTLESLAPKLIHEEGDIIKRSLRDVFTPDIEEILIEGESTFKSTRAFLKLLMPTQVKKVKQYKEKVPMFQYYQIENQLEAIHSNVVQLKSGGYLVIDQTEALVAVDVNSGRATREHDIEETALKTNLETCEEVARQLRLRDLAGLVVIDFIDMDEPKNNAAVERALKEALKKDRARIQVGRISGFGLIEMSRQRLHSSFLESSYHVCQHCSGKGVVRSVESCAMHALHLLEEAAVKNGSSMIVLSLPPEVASYVLNHKRANLGELEAKYQVTIQVLSDPSFLKTSDYRVERLRQDGERMSVYSQMMMDQQEAARKNALKKQEKQEKIDKKDKQPEKQEKKERQEKQAQPQKKEKEKPHSAQKKTQTNELQPEKKEPAAPEDISEKTQEGEKKSSSRNRRRRDWKRRRENRHQEADVADQTAEVSVDSNEEEHFKVVAQEDIVSFNQKNDSSSVEGADVVSSVKQEKPSQEISEKQQVSQEVVLFEEKETALVEKREDKVVHQKSLEKKEPRAKAEHKPVEKKFEPVESLSASDEPKKRGWWNKLMD